MRSKIFSTAIITFVVAAIATTSGFSQISVSAPTQVYVVVASSPQVQVVKPGVVVKPEISTIIVNNQHEQLVCININKDDLKKSTVSKIKISQKVIAKNKADAPGPDDDDWIYTIPPVAFGYKDVEGYHFQYADPDIQETDYKEIIKNYSKTYRVDADDKLEIDNLYGKISINTWNRNEIKVEVQVKVAANKEDDAKKLLNNVTINNSKKGSTISFKTNIAKENVWELLTGNNKNIFRRVDINYVVYMPAKNALDISNHWGTIELPDFDGKVVINCSYTNLIAQSLTNTAEIHINNGDAKIANLKISDLNISYGSLNLGSADKLTAVVNFSSAKIGKINTSGVINMKYGTGLQIDDLDKNMKNLLVNSSFSDVKLGLSENENANFDVTVRNGSFNYGSHDVYMATKVPTDNKKGWNPTQNYRGHLGKGNVNKVININSSYGTVKFD